MMWLGHEANTSKRASTRNLAKLFHVFSFTVIQSFQTLMVLENIHRPLV